MVYLLQGQESKKKLDFLPFIPYASFKYVHVNIVNICELIIVVKLTLIGSDLKKISIN